MNGIYLRDGDDLVPMRETPYEAERVLQELLAKHPEVLSGDRASDNRAWLLVKREAGVSAGSLDHLFLDHEGIPTLVEVKRSSDTRIRREVVGQMLDYAANAAHDWTLEALRAWFEAECAAHGRDADAALREVLEPNDTPDEFWESVHTNLAAGKLRLVFVADVIPSELRRVIEFLNGQMTATEVLAIEVKQYVDRTGARQTIVPTVVGQTEAAKHVKRQRSGRSWNRESILSELETRRGSAENEVAKRIFAWADERGDLRESFGQGQKDGSYQAGLDDGDTYLFPFVLYTYGKVEIQFQYMRRRPPFDREDLREEFRRQLASIPRVVMPPDTLDVRPSIPLEILAGPGATDGFLEAVDWALATAAGNRV